MYSIFLDESGCNNLIKVDPKYPIFVLAGCIIEENYYNQKFIKKVDNLKIKYFGTKEIILRSYDIRKQKNQFSILVDKHIRDFFYLDINKLITDLNMVILSAVIDIKELKRQYLYPTDPYELCLTFLMERFCIFLGRRRTKGSIKAESRENHNDNILNKYYIDFRLCGNNNFSALEVQSKFINNEIIFHKKNENINGLQIADLIAYPIGTHVLKPDNINPAFDIVEKKLAVNPKTGKYIGYGLKIFP